MAANKTEAIRLAISRYYEETQFAKKEISEEPLEQSTIETQWNNASDQKAADFYLKRHVHGKRRKV